MIEEVWAHYQGNLKAFIRSRVSNPDDADDLFQEVMLKIHDGLGSVKNVESIKSWLFQIANNTIIDYYRKSARNRDIQPDQLWYDYEEPSVQQELENCIEPFINALPPDTARLLRDIELKGMSQKDYAKQQGIAYSTLKSRVQKGRADLRGMFDQCCNFALDSSGNIADFTEKSTACKNC